MCPGLNITCLVLDASDALTDAHSLSSLHWIFGSQVLFRKPRTQLKLGPCGRRSCRKNVGNAWECAEERRLEFLRFWQSEPKHMGCLQRLAMPSWQSIPCIPATIERAALIRQTPGASFITVAYAQNLPWKIYKNKRDGKICAPASKLWPMRTNSISRSEKIYEVNNDFKLFSCRYTHLH